MKSKLFILLFPFSLACQLQAQKFEGLAPTPTMGWNSWNTFATKINDTLVREIADKLVSSGMKAAGYNYLVLDDGWMAKERDPKTGNLVPDPQKFPNGLEPLIEYVHNKGLKFGLYNCAGTNTCGGYPGTRGYEYQDARWYASMKIDFLKYDWCFTEGITAKEAYTTMSKAIKAAGRPMLFNLCEWGSNEPWMWAAPVGQSWRISGDIFNCFDCVKDWGTWKSLGVVHVIDARKNIRQYSGPNHWNDFDMMEVGHGMSVNEDRAHFSMWCMLASPLIAGNDLREMKPETVAILTNKQAIAINQDSLGVQAYLHQQKDSVDTWVKPLANGEVAICFLNRAKTDRKINFNWKENRLTDTVSKTAYDFTKSNYSIQTIWQSSTVSSEKKKLPALPTTTKPFAASVNAHDVVLIRLKKI